MPLRRAAARILLLAFSALAGLAVAEVAVHLVRPQAVMTVSRGLYEPDPPRRYRLRPGFQGTITNRVEFTDRVSINRAGLRGPEIGPKPRLRVLALGDSFVFGVGAQERETFPARLQEILRSRNASVEVLNAGAPGYGVPDEVAWFERWGRPLAPDVIVVSVFIGNDLQDAAPGGPKPAAVDGALVLPGETTGSLSRWLYYHSQLFVLIKNSSLGGSLRRLLGRPEPLEAREQREEFALYAKGEPAATVQGGALATERAVAELAASAGKARLLAVLIPSVIQVDPRRWQGNLRRFGLDPSRYDRGRPNEIFRQIFARHGIPVLDLLGPFGDAISRGGKIYYPIDQHLTPAGYALTASEVAARLQAGSR